MANRKTAQQFKTQTDNFKNRYLENFSRIILKAPELLIGGFFNKNYQSTLNLIVLKFTNRLVHPYQKRYQKRA